MGRLQALTLRCAIPVAFLVGGAGLWAAVSVDAISSVQILAPGGTTAEQEMVIGSVVLPLEMSIGATVGSISLGTPPATFLASGQFRIGTDLIQRDIGSVVARSSLQRASFTIIGDQDQVVSITVPPSVPLSGLSGEGEVEFTPQATVNGGGLGESRLVASADGTGTLAFDVGGRLDPSTSASAGAYAGVMQVTVQYN
jgi:hypothetical protein